MYQKIGIKVTPSYSPNFSLKKRSKKIIRFIVIHYTGMKTESGAIRRLQDPKYKVSAHFCIKKNGNILNSGNHEFLINNCEEYKSLYQKQLK